MNKRITIEDLFPDYLDGNGLFSKMGELFDLPWGSVYDNANIDLDYVGKYGSRIASPLAIKTVGEFRIIDGHGEYVVDENGIPVVTGDNLSKLANVVWRRFGENWKRLYDTMSLQYNPIENYSMVEEETGQGTHSNSRNTSQQGSGTTTDNQTVTNTGTITTEGQNDVFGFNSNDSVHANENTGKTTNNLTQTTGTNGTTSNNVSGTDTENGSNSNTRRLTRSGNIGVTTSQQMLQSERDLWLWDYFDVIYKQLNSILSIPYYD